MDDDVSWMDDHTWRPAAAAGAEPTVRPGRSTRGADAPHLPAAPADVPWHADPVVTEAPRPTPVRVVHPHPSRPVTGLTVVDRDRPGTFVLVNGSATVVPMDRAAAIAAGYVVLDTEAAEASGRLETISHSPEAPAAATPTPPAPRAEPPALPTDRLPFDDRRAAPLRVVPPLPSDEWTGAGDDDVDEVDELPDDDVMSAMPAVPAMPAGSAMPVGSAADEGLWTEPPTVEATGLDVAPPLEERARPWALEVATAVGRPSPEEPSAVSAPTVAEPLAAAVSTPEVGAAPLGGPTLPVGADAATIQGWLRDLARRRSVGVLTGAPSVPVGVVPAAAPVVVPMTPVGDPGPTRVPFRLPDAPSFRLPESPTSGAPTSPTPPTPAPTSAPTTSPTPAPTPGTSRVTVPAPEPRGRPSTRGLGPVVLRARGLTVRSGRGRRATELLGGVDLDVRAGEIVLIDGPSGSGKSLLLRTLAGIEHVDDGAVELSGADLLRGVDPDRSRRRAVLTGFVHQSPHLVPTLDAADNAAMPLLLAGWSSKDARDEVREAFRVLGLEHLGRTPVDRLHVGEQQRINIARALVGGPTVVFADEPTGTLDDASAGAVLELLADVAAEGIAVVLVCHDPRARGLAHRVLGMAHGRLRGGPRR